MWNAGDFDAGTISLQFGLAELFRRVDRLDVEDEEDPDEDDGKLQYYSFNKFSSVVNQYLDSFSKYIPFKWGCAALATIVSQVDFSENWHFSKSKNGLPEQKFYGSK